MYGGIPHGDAWNPIARTLFVQIRRATVKLLSFFESAYWRGMFGDRHAHVYTWLYCLLTAEAACEMVEYLNVVQARGSVVLVMIYDSLVHEHDGPLPIYGMSLVEKELPRWQDNLFKAIRTASDRTTEVLLKLALGKQMRILTALLNVGSSTIQKAAAAFVISGPRTYLRIRQYLVAKRTGQYLQTPSLRELASAPSGHALVAHAYGHCIGVAVSIADTFAPTSSASIRATFVTSHKSLPRATLARRRVYSG